MSTIKFIIEAAGIIAVLVLFAYVAEMAGRKKRGVSGPVITTRMIAMVGVFAAISAVLMVLELPVPFAPPFYKIDLSEVPALLLSFAYGPAAGVLCEFLKILIKLVIKGTSSAFVGELANLVIGCSFILPAGMLYTLNKTKKQAIIACVTGTLIMTVFGSLFNGIYLLPKFAEVYGMPLDQIVAMGTAVNDKVTSVYALVLLCVVPLNLLKGTIDSLIVILLYKKLRPILRG